MTRSAPVAGFLLLIATFAAYRAVILHGGFIWDDDTQVMNNLLLRSWAGLAAIWMKVGPLRGGTPQYYPLSFSVLWAEYQAWGLNPRGYHVVNVLLHALNAFLAWRVLKRLEVRGAFFAAMVFALHPVNAESVAWIIEIKNVLSCAAALLSVDCFLRGEGKSRRSLFFFALALLAKTSTVILPGVLLVIMWWKEGKIDRRALLKVAPMLALGLIAGLVTMRVETRQVGASGGEWALGPAGRILLAGRLIWFYAGKLVYPRDLTMIYPRWVIDVWSLKQWLYPLTALAVPAALWAGRDRIGRGPLAAALLYLISLLPVLGFINVYFMRYSYAADHFQYLAGISLLAALSAGAARLSDARPKAAPFAGALLLTFLGLLTARRAPAYSGLQAAWEDNLRVNPDSWLAHNNYGAILGEQGRFEEAVSHYRETLRLNPAYVESLNNLCVTFTRMNRLAEAEAECREALLRRPNFVDAHFNLGNALAAQGKVAPAAVEYDSALRLDPALPQARCNLGVMLAALGRLPDAEREYREALRLKPDLAEAHAALGTALARRGALAEAIAELETSLRLNPADANALRSLALARKSLSVSAPAARSASRPAP